MSTALPGTGVPVTTAPVATINGAGATASEVIQRVAIGLLSGTAVTDLTAASGVPIAMPGNSTFSGTFTAADAVVAAPVGDGTLVSGASTAGSVIALQVPDGFQAWTSLMTGWANGTVYSEASCDSTNGTDGNWVDVKGRRTGTAPGVESVVYAQVANGYYRGNLAGFKWFRLRFMGGATFPAVRIYLSSGQGATFLNSGIPGGSSTIGAVTGPSAAALALDGTDITTPTAMPAGGVGIRGWLSAIWTKLNGTLDVGDRAARLLGVVASITGALPTGANTIGAVTGPAAAPLALDATLTGGTLKAIARTAAKGTALAADLTSNPVDANTQALHVNLAGTNAVNATLAAETTKVIGTVNVAAAQTIAVTQSTAAAAAGGWPTKITDGTNVAAVKAGVVAAAGDNPLVVTIHPSSAATAVQPVSQGTAGALAAAWPAKITDGTTAAKVTVANAQPASTDGALLVNSIDTFAGTAFASASRAAGTVTFDIVNYNGKGIRVWQDLTVLGASSVVTITIQEKDPVSGKFINILASAATGAGINATGTAKLTVYPGLTAAANSIASDVLPVNIRISVTVATAASTFSVGYSLIP